MFAAEPGTPKMKFMGDGHDARAYVPNCCIAIPCGIKSGLCMSTKKAFIVKKPNTVLSSFALRALYMASLRRDLLLANWLRSPRTMKREKITVQAMTANNVLRAIGP